MMGFASLYPSYTSCTSAVSGIAVGALAQTPELN
jgi:hypothetical protein